MAKYKSCLSLKIFHLAQIQEILQVNQKVTSWRGSNVGELERSDLVQ